MSVFLSATIAIICSFLGNVLHQKFVQETISLKTFNIFAFVIFIFIFVISDLMLSGGIFITVFLATNFYGTKIWKLISPRLEPFFIFARRHYKNFRILIFDDTELEIEKLLKDFDKQESEITELKKQISLASEDKESSIRLALEAQSEIHKHLMQAKLSKIQDQRSEIEELQKIQDRIPNLPYPFIFHKSPSRNVICIQCFILGKDFFVNEEDQLSIKTKLHPFLMNEETLLRIMGQDGYSPAFFCKCNNCQSSGIWKADGTGTGKVIPLK